MIAPLLIEDRFFDQAEALRNQFEWRVCAGLGDSGDGALLAYSADDNAFRFLSATADQVFGQEVLLNFLERLRAWAKEKLGVAHASSPRVQVYTKGCWRLIARDDARAKWHYLFALTPGLNGKSNRVSVLTEPAPNSKRRWFGVSLSRVASVQLEFNQLLVHQTTSAYGVEELRKSCANPLESTVILDGFLW